MDILTRRMAMRQLFGLLSFASMQKLASLQKANDNSPNKSDRFPHYQIGDLLLCRFAVQESNISPFWSYLVSEISTISLCLGGEDRYYYSSFKEWSPSSNSELVFFDLSWHPMDSVLYQFSDNDKSSQIVRKIPKGTKIETIPEIAHELRGGRYYLTSAETLAIFGSEVKV